MDPLETNSVSPLETNSVSPSETSVHKSWVDVRAEADGTSESVAHTQQQQQQQQQQVEGKHDGVSNDNNNNQSNVSSDKNLDVPRVLERPSSSLSPLLVERHKDEEVSSVLSSPVSHAEHIHSDSSSGESFDVSDAFDTLSTVRRASLDQVCRQKEPLNTDSPASVGQLSEDEDAIDSTRRGRSASMSSRKRRGPQMGQGYFSIPVATATSAAPITSSSRTGSTPQLSSSASAPSFIAAPPPPAASAATATTYPTASEETGVPLTNAYFPCALPPQFLPLLQAINARVVSMSMISFLAGMVVAWWWLKRQASIKKSDRLQTEASLRQMLALKEAEVNRLSNLFEKYLSRPLFLRYLPNRF